MVTDKEIRDYKFVEKASKEIEYILTSTDKGYVLKKGDAVERDKVLGRLFDGMARSVKWAKKRGDNIDMSDPRSIVMSSPYYKLAECCKAATTWKEFKDLLAVNVPTYAGKASMALDLGGFHWKLAFNPPTRMRRRSRKEVKATELTSLQNGQVAPELPPNVVALMNEELGKLRTFCEAISAKMGEFLEVYNHHVHPGNLSTPKILRAAFVPAIPKGEIHDEQSGS